MTNQRLTNRELEVLNLCADGLTQNAIADKLVISIKTVESHVRTIKLKMDADTVAQAVGKAIALGELERDGTASRLERQLAEMKQIIHERGWDFECGNDNVVIDVMRIDGGFVFYGLRAVAAHAVPDAAVEMADNLPAVIELVRSKLLHKIHGVSYGRVR